MELANTVVALSWVVFAATIILLFVTIWHWKDTYDDWRDIRLITDDDSPEHTAAWGAMQMAWARMANSLLWFIIGFLLIAFGYPLRGAGDGDDVRVWLRIVMLALVLIDIIKISIERIMRVELIREVARKRERKNK